jgi:hypothetical protein
MDYKILFGRIDLYHTDIYEKDIINIEKIPVLRIYKEKNIFEEIETQNLN